MNELLNCTSHTVHVQRVARSRFHSCSLGSHHAYCIAARHRCYHDRRSVGAAHQHQWDVFTICNDANASPQGAVPLLVPLASLSTHPSRGGNPLPATGACPTRPPCWPPPALHLPRERGGSQPPSAAAHPLVARCTVPLHPRVAHVPIALVGSQPGADSGVSPSTAPLFTCGGVWLRVDGAGDPPGIGTEDSAGRGGPRID